MEQFSWVFLVGGLGLFLFGMRTLSEGLQNAAGGSLRKILSTITGTRLMGVLTGIAVTATIQSSSATTVMVVSFVNAGLLTLQQAVGVILGANIGTTITGWIVSILGFKVKIASFALPAIGIGVLGGFLSKGKRGIWFQALVGFGILFLGLQFMKDAVPDISENPEALAIMARYSASSFSSMLLAILIGSAVTFVVQSSSATMALTIAAAASGFIDFPTACALVLGQNIGTTITALLSSLGGNTSARRAAVAHLLFNSFGVIWMLPLFRGFIGFVDRLVPGAAMNNPEAIPVHLAAFHTAFNLTNTLIFLPLVPLIVKAATKLVRGEEEEVFVLRPFSSRVLSTPATGLEEVREELIRMSGFVREMLGICSAVFQSPRKKMGNEVKRLGRREEVVDNLELEITRFCAHLIKAPLSFEMAKEAAHAMSIASELERIGDHCELFMKHTTRMYDGNIAFTEGAIAEMEQIAGQARVFLELIHNGIEGKGQADLMESAQESEERIDNMRNSMRAEHIQRLKDGTCEFDAGLIYLDMLTSLEKIGDHAYNIAEELTGRK